MRAIKKTAMEKERDGHGRGVGGPPETAGETRGRRTSVASRNRERAMVQVLSATGGCGGVEGAWPWKLTAVRNRRVSALA